MRAYVVSVVLLAPASLAAQPNGPPGVTITSTQVIVRRPGKPDITGPLVKPPGPQIGSEGYVTFMYRKRPQLYLTVRAEDGNVWLAQALGASRVAADKYDRRALGDLFQWGRWDDGHQVREPANTRNVDPKHAFDDPEQFPTNPAQIGGREIPFLYGLFSWWRDRKLTDQWTAASPSQVTATNGADPCKAIGPGWHLPSEEDFRRVAKAAVITDENGAWQSKLKLSATGVRAWGTGEIDEHNSAYWTSTPGPDGTGVLFEPASGTIRQNERAFGLSIRCLRTAP